MSENVSRIIRKTRRAINEPGHVHELTFSCFQRWPLLSRELTRNWFIDAFAQARTAHDVRIWAYVIMPEHAHLLIHPERHDYNISAILKSIKQPVARRATNFLREADPQFLERLRVERPGGRVEYRFWQQGGGYDRNIYSPTAALASIEYIEANPVRRGLVTTPTEWIWSSARFHAGIEDVPLKVDPIEL